MTTDSSTSGHSRSAGCRSGEAGGRKTRSIPSGIASAVAWYRLFNRTRLDLALLQATLLAQVLAVLPRAEPVPLRFLLLRTAKTTPMDDAPERTEGQGALELLTRCSIAPKAFLSTTTT